MMRNIARKFRHEGLKFGWLDGERYARFLSRFGVSTLPDYFIFKASTDGYFYELEKGQKEQDVTAFIEKVLKGEIEERSSGGIMNKLHTISMSFLWSIQDHPWIFLLVVGFFTILCVVGCVCEPPVEDLKED